MNIISSYLILKDCGGLWGLPIRMFVAPSPVVCNVRCLSVKYVGNALQLKYCLPNLSIMWSSRNQQIKKNNVSVLYVPCIVWWLICTCRTSFVVIQTLSNGPFGSVTVTTAKIPWWRYVWCSETYWRIDHMWRTHSVHVKLVLQTNQ